MQSGAAGFHMTCNYGMYPQRAADAASAGSTELETLSYDVELPYSHEAWRGRIRASAV